jgi:histone-binding protein RBBP4
MMMLPLTFILVYICAGKDYSIQRLILDIDQNLDEDDYDDVIEDTQSHRNGKQASSNDSTEEGTYGQRSAKVSIIQRITHPTEVHRARYMPHNPNLIATKTATANVLVFDRSKHPSTPDDNKSRPDLTLTGHTSEGYGLAWNPHESHQSHLLSGSDDALCCVWDISQGSKQQQT